MLQNGDEAGTFGWTHGEKEKMWVLNLLRQRTNGWPGRIICNLKIEDSKDWYKLLPYLLFDYRGHKHG